MSGINYMCGLCGFCLAEASRPEQVIKQFACCFASKEKKLVLGCIFLFIDTNLNKSVVKLLLSGLLLALNNYRCGKYRLCVGK